jgi:hypothetical protein
VSLKQIDLHAFFFFAPCILGKIGYYSRIKKNRLSFFSPSFFFPPRLFLFDMATFKKTSQAPFSGKICGIGAGYVGGPTMAMVRCFFSIPYPRINSSPVPRIFRKIRTRPVVCLPSVSSVWLRATCTASVATIAAAFYLTLGQVALKTGLHCTVVDMNKEVRSQQCVEMQGMIKTGW